ncbi:MAG: tripartite tricarboxylate transporter TctB family protein [Burkholderiales bacterium]|nr:tripartite tricarboxylate transporter TctB family protein [Burkholderiales bacterium]
MLWLTQDFGPRARMIPLPLAVLGIVLTVIQLVWQNLRSTDELRMDMISVGAAPRAAGPGTAAEGEGGGGKRREGWREEARAFGIVLALFGLILAVGLIPAVFLFTCGYFVLTREYAWRESLIYTGCLTAAVYALFMVALEVQPYHGLLRPFVELVKAALH